MKVIYESLDLQVRKALHAADEAGRHIHHIEVTLAEANEFSEITHHAVYRYWGGGGSPKHYTAKDSGAEVGSMYGTRLRIEAKPSYGT